MCSAVPSPLSPSPEKSSSTRSRAGTLTLTWKTLKSIRTSPKKTIDSTPVDFKHLVHFSPDSGVAFSATGLIDSPILSRCSNTASDDELSNPSSPTNPNSPTMSMTPEPSSPPLFPTRTVSAMAIGTPLQTQSSDTPLSRSLGTGITQSDVTLRNADNAPFRTIRQTRTETVMSPPPPTPRSPPQANMRTLKTSRSKSMFFEGDMPGQPRTASPVPKSSRFMWGRRAHSLVPGVDVDDGQDTPPPRRATTSNSSPFNSPFSKKKGKGKSKLPSDPPWFYRKKTKKETNQALLGQKPGTFVVRPSQSKPGNFAISVVHRGGLKEEQMVVWHGMIFSSHCNPLTYRLGTESRAQFESLEALVSHFQRIPYTSFDNGRISLCLGGPIEKIKKKNSKSGGVKSVAGTHQFIPRVSTVPPDHSPLGAVADAAPQAGSQQLGARSPHQQAFVDAQQRREEHKVRSPPPPKSLQLKLAKQNEYRARTMSTPSNPRSPQSSAGGDKSQTLR